MFDFVAAILGTIWKEMSLEWKPVSLWKPSVPQRPKKLSRVSNSWTQLQLFHNYD